MPGVLRFPDAETIADLATFIGRARRVDQDGAARLVAQGDVLAVYVSPVHGGGGPVVLGLRTARLAPTGGVDVTVPLAALHDRLTGDDAGRTWLDVPAEVTVAATWAGLSPPRGGWHPMGALDSAVIVAAATAGIAEVAGGTPPGAGAAAVAALRARVWGRPLADERPELHGLPAGAAYAAEALGFVDGVEPAAVYRAGPWWRVTTGRGHVLARRPAL